MSRIVLDASVLLAIVRGESGSEKVTAGMLLHSVTSAVNLAEVYSKLLISGWNQSQAWEDGSALVEEVIPFTAAHAKLTGDLILQTRPLGLSLGDRACLALALDLKAPVYTADRSWKKLDVGVPIHTIR